MGLKTYHIIIIVIAVILVIAIILALLKKRRQAERNQDELQTVTTIQSVYYEPAKYTQHPASQNTYVISSAPGWNLTNLDAPTSSVNIRQPSASGVVISREPMVFTQTGNILAYMLQICGVKVNIAVGKTAERYPPYPVHEANAMQQQVYGKPPPYNPAFHHPSTSSRF